VVARRGGFAVERVLDIDRAPSDVFDFLADTASFPVVDLALVDYQPRGQLVEGLEGTFTHRRGGMTARTTWRVEELVAPARLRVSIAGLGYGMESLVELADDGTGDGDGTVARFVDAVWPTNLYGRVLVALSGGIMRRDLQARAERLKAILESAPEPGPAVPAQVR
jgi:hypothetical protein